MGFAYFFIKIPNWMNGIMDLLNQLNYFNFMIAHHLGLLKPPEQANSEEHLLTYGLSPSPVPVTVYAVTSLIKKRLPVVQYGKLLERFKELEDDNMACAVCLDLFQKKQEIRELFNCSHVFHKECLDRWMDQGEVTCPLCRSMLYPAPACTGRRGNSLMVENNY